VLYKMTALPISNQTTEENLVEHSNWECPKCQNKEFEAGQFAATGGGLTKFLNIQNKKFTTVTCTQSSFTEMYKTSTSALGNVLDVFGN